MSGGAVAVLFQRHQEGASAAFPAVIRHETSDSAQMIPPSK
jgi:hypothetical protein